MDILKILQNPIRLLAPNSNSYWVQHIHPYGPGPSSTHRLFNTGATEHRGPSQRHERRPAPWALGLEERWKTPCTVGILEGQELGSCEKAENELRLGQKRISHLGSLIRHCYKTHLEISMVSHQPIMAWAD